MAHARTISVVIPIHNEAGNITPLDAELKKVLAALGRHEIIYVNDGSVDASLDELKSLSGVTILNLNRSYGQATAMDAGFKAANGELVVSMDGDGQNDPNDIPKLIEKLDQERLDVVAGWRKVRKDAPGIRILTGIGRMFRRLVINDPVHDSGCTLRVYTREAVRSLDIGGEMHRYILALLRWKGFRIGEVVVNDRARANGRSKYGYSKAVRGFIDLLYVWFIFKYSQRPLHLFGYFSLVACVFALISFAETVYDKFYLHVHLNHNGWFFLTFFFALTAVMLFSFGILIDLAIRIYLNTSPHETRYHVRETIKT